MLRVPKSAIQKCLLSTFGNQSAVPNLPVPSIDNLKIKYLKSLKPVITNQKQLQTSNKVIEAFFEPGKGNVYSIQLPNPLLIHRAIIKRIGFGLELQSRLEEFAKHKDNWLEKFWLQKAYLEWREPSLINVNYWCEFVDHPEQPKDLLVKPPPKGSLTAFQIKRAAGLINNFLNFNDMLNKQDFPAEFIKKSPLCMNQYKRIFGTTRIPGEKSDTLVHQYPTTSYHIIVLCRDLIYKVPVIGNDGKRVTIEELERVLLEVGRMSLETVSTKTPVPIGVLTAGHRDDWYKAYTKLEELSPENKENMQVIQSALFAVCLDDTGVKRNKDESHQRIFHNGNALNRWFDKSLQIIVSSSGRAGVNGEHSPSDAVVPGTCIEYVLKNEPATSPQGAGGKLAPPRQLVWTTDASIKDSIKTCKKTAKALIDDTESCLLQTGLYGSRFMKEVAQTSPDAYIQMALQLTWWRLYKKPTPVYESASTRLFKGGRTETGRSTSEESVAFCKSFDNDDVLYDEKRKLFREAVATQGGYMREAAMGMGIDRHMLGLRCMIKPDELSKATMFTDPSYTDSMWFKLSTSNMSPGRYFYGGFGPVVPDGYGINYAIDKDNLKFSISSKRSCPTTSSYKFRERLEQTLIDMLILFPKRSEVWGFGWEKKFEEERKAERAIETMRSLTGATKKNFYLEAGEKKCFREELSPETSIVGAFAVFPFHKETQKYEAYDSNIKVEVVVTHDASNHVIVQKQASQTGKFHFTANEHGLHLICLSVNGAGWYGVRSKVNLDIQFGGEDTTEVADHSSAVLDVKFLANELIHQVANIRNELRLQRDREGELREVSEVINSHTYRFTLVQIFVLVLTGAWQLRQLKQFFTTKKLV